MVIGVALRAWCAWLTEEHYLETNPAKRLKLVGRQEVSSREGLAENEVNARLAPGPEQS